MNRSSLWLALSLILAVWITRMIGIGVFPPFIDETIHIHSSEIILRDRTPFYSVELGRQFTMWWLLLFQPSTAASMWVARAATLLAVLPGFAALLSIARLAAGRWAMLLFGLLYLLSTYHMFFERLALADPIAGSALSLAIYFAYRLALRMDLRDAILTGVFLFIAFGAKTSAAPFFGVPIAAVVALTPPSTTWRSSLKARWRWLAAALGTAFGLTMLFVIILRIRGYDIITNSLSLAVSGRGTIDPATILSPQRILDNITLTFNTLMAYFGIAPMIALLIAVLVLIVRRRWYLPLCLLGPVGIIWLNTVQETRYYATAMALLLLCGALGLTLLTRHNTSMRWLALGGIALWGLLYWLPFTLSANSNPAELALPSNDYQQYVLSDASGFGFAEIYSALRDLQPRQVIGALSNCQGLRFSTLHDFPLNCPLIRPGGQDREALAALFAANRIAGTYLVLEDSPYVPSTAPGKLITVIDVGRPRLSIYDLTP